MKKWNWKHWMTKQSLPCYFNLQILHNSSHMDTSFRISIQLGHLKMPITHPISQFLSNNISSITITSLSLLLPTAGFRTGVIHCLCISIILLNTSWSKWHLVATGAFQATIAISWSPKVVYDKLKVFQICRPMLGRWMKLPESTTLYQTCFLHQIRDWAPELLLRDSHRIAWRRRRDHCLNQ